MVKKLPLRGRFCLGNLPSFILIVVFSALIFVGMGFFSETYTDFYFASCFDNPVLIILNFAPILLFMLFVYAITANSPFSIAFTGALFLSMGLINNFKILFRDDPFVISDLGLGRELVGILGGFDIRLMVMALGGIILIAIILFLLLYFFRGAKLKWWLRLTICLLCVAASVSLYFVLYSDDEIYDNLPVEGSIYCQYDQYSSKGWAYCFIYEAKKLVIKAPEGYNAAEYKNYESASDSSKQYDGSVKPHVIMIMSEAFTDLSENEYLDFSGYRDPIANYKAIAADAVVSGYVAVDVYGGGTATTEFEVLSAIDVDAFDTSTSPYNLIRKDFYALPGIMKDLGYATAALHPGDGWFYNRDNVYRYMGFDNFLNLGNGVDEDAEKKGGYVSEAATYDYLTSLLSPVLSADRDPLFEFCVTIQNHGGYALKYGNLPPNFTTTANLDDAALNQLTNYFHGVIDADEELGDFIASIKDSGEPIIVVYWGDHYPSLQGVYDEIGYGYKYYESYYTDMDMYFTPFFIWQNEAAASVTTLAENAESLGLGSDELFNASFLGSTLLQLLGFDDVSEFMSFANEVRDIVPVKIRQGYIDSNGVASQTLTGERQEIDEKYTDWSYYMMFDK